jgi:transcriptional regulator with XRE-family HTH domain
MSTLPTLRWCNQRLAKLTSRRSCAIQPLMNDTILRRLIGELLNRHRRQKGMTQEELASQANLQRTSITNIEKGRQMMSLTALYDLAEALDIEPTDLLPTRQNVKDELALLHKLPSSKTSHNDIAHWIQSVTTDAE